MEKLNPYKSKNRQQRHEPTPASLFSPAKGVSYLSRTVKALCWQERIWLQHTQS